jgi:hypothetical protein
VPDLVKEEFINIGILVRDVTDSQPPTVAFTRDWTRLLSFDEEADLNMLKCLEEDFKIHLAEKREDGTKPFFDTILDSFSNNLQVSKPKGRSAESMNILVKELMSLYVYRSVTSSLAMAV